MRYYALAMDYDGAIALDGRVPESTAIRELGLELQVIFNKGSVMDSVPPSRTPESARATRNGVCRAREIRS
jgi:hypothetical protein